MATIVVLFLSVITSSLVGYFVHRLIHKEWMGPLYRGHMEHHLTLYPASRLTSESYELVKWYNSGPILFTPAAALLIALVGGVFWSLGLHVSHFATFAVGLIAFGFLNDYVHDSFHLRRHWLQKNRFYRRLRRAHFAHHADMTKDFGIVVMFWDGVFKTKSHN